MAAKVGINIYINSIKHNTLPESESQVAYNISDMVEPGGLFDIQVSNVFDDDTESELSPIQSFTLDLDTVNLTSIVQWFQEVRAYGDSNGNLFVGEGAKITFDNGAYAKRAFNGDNAISFKGNESGNGHQILGIANSYSNITDDNLNIQFNFFVIGLTCNIREMATNKKTVTITAESVMTIRVNNNVVSFEIDGVTEYTSPLTIQFPLAPIGIVRNNANVGKLRNVQFENLNNLVDSHLIGATGETPVFSETNKVPAFTVNSVSLNSLYWPEIHLSALWPEVPTTKKYFVLYSSDHSSTLSVDGIAWGEFNDIIGDKLTGFYLEGFVELGMIFSGNQIETPRLIRVPTSRSGINEEIFLYGHANDGHPSVSTGTQQTVLYTTTGGAFHTATWTLRGAVLGLEAGEDHTGYLIPFWDDVRNLYVGRHSFSGISPDDLKGKVSHSLDGINWVRIKTVDPAQWLNPPSGFIYDKMYTFPFEYNGSKYAFVPTRSGSSNTGISITTLDDDYVPIEFKANIITYSSRAVACYFRNNKAHFLVKKTVSADFFIYVFDLEDLKFYI